MTQSPQHETHLVATLTRLPGDEVLSALPTEVEWLEVRGDLLGEVSADDLGRLRQSARKLLWTLRSREEGGSGPDGPKERQPAILAAVASGLFDLIDLEAERDLLPAILEAVTPERRLLSWHGPVTTLPELEERFEEMAATPARAYKLIPAAEQPGDEIAPLALLASLGRSDVTAFATGEIASWTRPVAAVLGAPFLFGSVRGESAGAPGQMTVERLVEDFHLPRSQQMPRVEWLAGLVGAPVEHSLSPRLHNRGYRALGVPALYVPFHVERFGDFWLEVVETGRLDELGLPLRGLSVTAPHKEIALAVAGAASPRAQSIGGANTLVRTSHGDSGPVWEAESTDPEGVLGPLAELGLALSGLPVAIVGVGGAGRAVAAGLLERRAKITLVNRSIEKGQKVADELDVPFTPLDDFDPAPYRVVVHATALGHHEDDPLPFEPAAMAEGAVVVDMVYDRRRETPLARAAREAGRTVVDGKEVLAAQAFEQFRMMTGRELPRELARRTVGLIPQARPATQAAGEGS